jgi:hypothetical protein
MDTENITSNLLCKGTAWQNHGGLFMKKLFFSLCLTMLFLLLMNFRSAESAGSVQLLNGHNWTSWNHEQKLSFIAGFIAGSDWVASNSLFSESLFPDDAFRQRSKSIWEEVIGEAGNALSAPKKQSSQKYTAIDVLMYSMYDAYKKNDSYQKAIIKVSDKDIADGLNQLYRTRENLKITVSNATYLVQKKLKGASADDINILLPYLRGEKEVPLGGIIPVYNNGKFIKIIEFP